MEIIKESENVIKIVKFGAVAGTCALLLPLAGVTVWVSTLETGTLRAITTGSLLALPIVAIAAWCARGFLARAEMRGLDTGMARTLDLVKAVRPAQQMGLPSATVAERQPLPYIPVDFQMLSQDTRVIEL